MPGLSSVGDRHMSDSTSTTAQGWVYLIVNDLIPDRVKIGFTKRDPIDRAYELISTGTTGTFVVIYQALVDEPFRIEQAVHRRFADMNRGLEWFEVCPNLAKEEIRTVARQVLYENTAPRWHPSQPVPSQRTRELLDEARKAAEAARRAEEADRARRAEQEAAARLAAEAVRIQRAREAEQERQRREREHQKIRAEEQARLAAEAESRQRINEERERQTRLVVARVRTAILVAVPTLIAVVAVFYVREQERKSHANSFAAHKAESERLRSDLKAIQATLNGYQANIYRLIGELTAAEKSVKTLVAEENRQRASLASAQYNLNKDEGFLRRLPAPDRAGATGRWAPRLEWLRSQADEAENELQAVQDALARARMLIKEIPQELSQLRNRVKELSAKKAECERDLAVAERSAASFIWATPDGGGSSQ